MQLEWLDDVVALLEEGNLSRAAARRNITQPAFSRRISGFEDWLGFPVLDRQTNRIEINPALRSNEQEIRALITRLRELPNKLAHYEPSRSVITLAGQHAPLCSAFPRMAQQAKGAFPGLQFRLRAGNLDRCVSMFLRGDADMLLCYEADNSEPMSFGPEISRGLLDIDSLAPVVGGALRSEVTDDGGIPSDTPAVIYPDDSYFGAVLRKTDRAFGTLESCANPVCVTAFSSATKDMVLGGLGLGWLPLSMVHRELNSGEARSLAQRYGQEALRIMVYANRKSRLIDKVLSLWTD
ncbi:MAG: LysR family transcriptional regulator [Pseudomonadota bacterium]